MKRVVTDDQLVNKWLSKKRDAKSRCIEFSLSLTSLRNIMRAEKCFFTGVKLCNETLSIDRIDNKLGYEKGNVCACHVDFNSLKGSVENNKSLDIELAMKGFKKAHKILSKKSIGKIVGEYGYSVGDYVARKTRKNNRQARKIHKSVVKVLKISNGNVTLEGCSREMNASQYEKVL